MKSKWAAFVAAGILCACAGNAFAEGELQIYNWADYTSDKLIKKFEKEHDVKVTITQYENNEVALTKVRQGGQGFDIVVPSANYVPIWINEGLVQETRPDQMSNFKNVDPRWVDASFDPGRRYSVPWQWGMMGMIVNRDVYSGDPNTSAIFLDPPAELVGKINVNTELSDVMFLAVAYAGGEPCTGDKEVLRKVRDTMLAAKPKWQSIDVGEVEKLVKGDAAASVSYNGPGLRARLQNKAFIFGYPKEGFPIFMDNVLVLKDAKNLENAKLFQNFIMDPENAALISEFAGYGNGIMGSDKFLPEEMKDAPEMSIPESASAAGKFNLGCSPEINSLYAKIWAEVVR